MNTATRLDELRRMRWPLWIMVVAFTVLGFFAGPVVIALAVVALILAVWNEMVIRQGRRLR